MPVTGSGPRVEDCVWHRQRHRHQQAPVPLVRLNQAWLAAALIAAALLAWLRLLALDGPLAKAEPKTLRYTALSTPPPGSPAAAGIAASRTLPPGPGHSVRDRLARITALLPVP